MSLKLPDIQLTAAGIWGAECPWWRPHRGQVQTPSPSSAGSLTLAIFPPRPSGLGSARTWHLFAFSFFPSKFLIAAISVHLKVCYDHLPHNCRSECKLRKAPGAWILLSINHQDNLGAAAGWGVPVGQRGRMLEVQWSRRVEEKRTN